MSTNHLVFHRSDLYERVWSKPMSQLATEYGLSDVGLAKICRRMGIPLPGVGYWAKVQAGHRMRRTRLPRLKADELDEVRSVRPVPIPADEAVAEADPQIAAEADPDHRIQVRAEPAELHPLVERTQHGLQHGTTTARGLLQPKRQGCLDVQVSAGLVPRAIAILDAFCKAVEERGWSVVAERPEVDDSVHARHEEHRLRAYHTACVVREERICFVLEELCDNRPETVTEMNRRLQGEKRYGWERPAVLYTPTGRLRFRIELDKWKEWGQIRRTWSDGKRHQLDEQLNDVCISLVRIAEAMKRQRRDAVAAEEQRREEERQRRDAHHRHEIEQARRKELGQRLDIMERADLLERYIARIRPYVNGLTHVPQTEAAHAWFTWVEGRLLALREVATDDIPPAIWTDPERHFYDFR